MHYHVMTCHQLTQFRHVKWNIMMTDLMMINTAYLCTIIIKKIDELLNIIDAKIHKCVIRYC